MAVRALRSHTAFENNPFNTLTNQGLGCVHSVLHRFDGTSAIEALEINTCNRKLSSHLIWNMNENSVLSYKINFMRLSTAL